MRTTDDSLFTPTSQLAQVALDTMRSQVCLLNEQGIIISTNRAWGQFAVAGGLRNSHWIGVSYLDVLDTCVGPDAEEAKEVARQLRRLLKSDVDQYENEYLCPSQGIDKYFLMHVSKSIVDQASVLVVLHIDVTDRHARAEIQKANEFKLAQALEALTEAESRFRGSFETATHGMAPSINGWPLYRSEQSALQDDRLYGKGIAHDRFPINHVFR